MGSPPTPTVAGTPAGKRINDGYQTLVTFNADTDISFWIISVTAPGLDGLAPIDGVTMHNVRWRQQFPRRLITLTEFSMTVGYDPIIYTDMLELMNVNTTITVHFPDGSSLAFYGFLHSFKPGALEDGKRPEATISVTPSNADPVDCSEQPPTYTAGTGTAPC